MLPVPRQLEKNKQCMSGKGIILVYFGPEVETCFIISQPEFLKATILFTSWNRNLYETYEVEILVEAS